MRRTLALVAALLLAPLTVASQPARGPAWQVCTQMIPGVAGARPYYRDCRPLPAACRDTPTCACMARAMPTPFRAGCHRTGHIFIRGRVALP